MNKSPNIEEHLNNLGRWTKFKKELCDSCIGLCCYMPVEVTIEDLIRLNIVDEFFRDSSIKEQNKIALKNSAILRYTPSTLKYTLSQKPNGACVFLENCRCTQYENRPNTCRNHPKIGPRPNYCAYWKK